jgi:hypothetical protein
MVDRELKKAPLYPTGAFFCKCCDGHFYRYWIMSDEEKKSEARPDQFLLAESKAKSDFFRTKPFFKPKTAPANKPGLKSVLKKILGLPD